MRRFISNKDLQIKMNELRSYNASEEPFSQPQCRDLESEVESEVAKAQQERVLYCTVLYYIVTCLLF